MSYNKYEEGSTWAKWDLHVHAPGTKKNNNFSAGNTDDGWTKYFEELSKLQEFRAIGITDYFCIEDYKRVAKYKSDGNLNNIDLILPNVELRLSQGTIKGSKINAHIIFSPDIVPQLDSSFFSRLEFNFQGKIYRCIKEDLIKLGRKVEETDSDHSAWLQGINQFDVSIAALNDIFYKDKELRSHALIGVANGSNDGISGLKDTEDASAFSLIKKDILYSSDIIFSGNPKDSIFFLGENEHHTADKIIQDYGKLKPCIHGSDAHSLERIGKPSKDRFCWIKATPTFEGLKQIVHEPGDRIKIQTDKPEEKHKSEYIKRIKFIDQSSSKYFINEEININQNLTTIIGGKSTGKSLLLDYINSTIDPGSKSIYDIPDIDFQVEWGDGEIYLLSDKQQDKSRQVTFIPQLYIETMLKDNKTQFNEIILKTLREKPEFNQHYNSHINKRRDKTVGIETVIISLMNDYKSLAEDKNELNSLGDRQAKITELEFIKLQIDNIRKASTLSDDQQTEFINLKSNEQDIAAEIKEKNALANVIEDLLDYHTNHTVNLLDKLKSNALELKSKLQEDSHSTVDETVENINLITLPYLEEIYNTFTKRTEIKERITILKNDLALNLANQAPLAEKIGNQSKTTELTIELNRFQFEIERIDNKAKSVQLYLNKINESKKLLLDNYTDLRNEYKNIVDKINNEYRNVVDDDGIRLIAKYNFNKDVFWDKFINLFNLKTTSFANLFNYDGKTIFENNDIYTYEDETHIEFIDKCFDILIDTEYNSKVKFKNSNINEDAIKGLFQDYFELTFTIEQDGDDIGRMSPGKKGLILLKLFLSLKNEKSPILIDQPEDNLDYRTIYNELKDFLKKRKVQRQIIMVTHNANLVVATDAELVIVASQAGQNKKENNKFKFEYVSGALEHHFQKNESCKGILYQMGIREHVCEILEGGQEAFEKREAKYGFLI
ncbi:TrlF family AAA-like ATPase [Hymenobacter psychrophilus]|uniref:Uncharacterized protein n=1 Tax=Hymenobacter psychrophilus TaxID=651662 RepID=A0A1H3HRC1_9BACT|nr:hypothetical protein [Hymenobacter psychrophilus]SDY18023.1 hypothetical protein SAMN04488069_106117 [Hymenobacter psychrophilus]